MTIDDSFLDGRTEQFDSIRASQSNNQGTHNSGIPENADSQKSGASKIKETFTPDNSSSSTHGKNASKEYLDEVRKVVSAYVPTVSQSSADQLLDSHANRQANTHLHGVIKKHKSNLEELANTIRIPEYFHFGNDPQDEYAVPLSTSDLAKYTLQIAGRKLLGNPLKIESAKADLLVSRVKTLPEWEYKLVKAFYCKNENLLSQTHGKIQESLNSLFVWRQNCVKIITATEQDRTTLYKDHKTQQQNYARQIDKIRWAKTEREKLCENPDAVDLLWKLELMGHSTRGELLKISHRMDKATEKIAQGELDKRYHKETLNAIEGHIEILYMHNTITECTLSRLQHEYTRFQTHRDLNVEAIIKLDEDLTSLQKQFLSLHTYNKNFLQAHEQFTDAYLDCKPRLLHMTPEQLDKCLVIHEQKLKDQNDKILEDIKADYSKFTGEDPKNSRFPPRNTAD